MRLDTASNHQWENVRRRDLRPVRKGRSLGWWVLLALISSSALHVLLVFLFSDLRISFGPRDISRTPEDTIPIKMDPRRMEADMPSTDLPEQLEPETAGEEARRMLETFDVQIEIPPEREILITPEVTRPENIALGGLESLPLPELEDSSLPGPGEAAGALKLPEEAPLSPDQLVIDSGRDEAADRKARGLLDEAGRVAQGIGDKYLSLGDLLGEGGGVVTDIGKPIYMPGDLLFEFASDNLRDSAKASLMMLGLLIEKNPDVLFIIEGHTDTIGTEERNLDLSRRRAAAVGNWLRDSLRIREDRFQLIGHGKSRPLVFPDGTIEQQQPNRRVEIRMVRPGGDGVPVRPARPVEGGAAVN